jgi:hypothetical protein
LGIPEKGRHFHVAERYGTFFVEKYIDGEYASWETCSPTRESAQFVADELNSMAKVLNELDAILFDNMDIT